MSSSKEKKEKILTGLRKNYIQYGIANHDGQSLAFYTIVESEIDKKRREEFIDQIASQLDYIYREKKDILADKSVKIRYGINIKKARSDYNHSPIMFRSISNSKSTRGYGCLTQQELSRCIDCSYATISSIENATGKSPIDRFYLEAFCIIFEQMPHELLGCAEIGNIKNSAGKPVWVTLPCHFYSTVYLTISRAITLNLYNEDSDSVEYKLQQLFDKLIELKVSDTLVSSLKEIPILKRQYCAPVVISSEEITTRWDQELSLKSDLLSGDTERGALHAKYRDFSRRLCLLAKRDPEYVELMYHISSGNDELKKFGYFVLNNGKWKEYCEFRRYDERG